MSATYFGYAANPANLGTLLDTSLPAAVTPPGSMAAGDLVYVEVLQRDPSVTLSVSNDGGQTWNSLTATASGSQTKRTFWCSFNGTWSANPSWTSTGTTGGLHFSVLMLVFRPSGTPTWAIDVAQDSGNATPGSPFDVTASGQTATASGVTVSSWYNTSYDGEVFSLQTGGWSNPSSQSQFRNTKVSPTGNEQTLSSAYKLNSGAGATGSVANRMTQSITTLWTTVTFKDQSVTAFTGTGAPASDATAIAGTGVRVSPVLRPYIAPVTSVKSGTVTISGSGTLA